MDSAFLNLLRGNRLKLYAGINMDLYPEVIYSKDYTYVEFKAARILTTTAEGKTKEVKKAKAGDDVGVVINCGVVKPHKYKVLVEPTPELINCFTYMGYQRLIEEGDVGEIVLSGKLQQDMDISTLGGACRVYLLA